jgi:hypothetical protein
MNDQILPPENNQGQSQSLSSYFEELTKPGGKFDKTRYSSDKDLIEAIAKSKFDSDNYIKTVESKSDQLREDLLKAREAQNAQANMQELIDSFKQVQQTKSDTTQQPQSQDNKPTFDPKEFASLVSEQVKQLDQRKTEQANLDLVRNKIAEKWGSNVPDSVRQQIDKLGELGTNLAKRYPDEFLRSIGAEQTQRQPDFLTPPRSNANSDTFKPQGPQERTWAWYENLRKTDPTSYHSRKMTVQMHNDAIRLGDRFMDGDFGVSDQELLTTKYKSIF